MNIIIGADIVPTKTNMSLFEQGKANELIGDELLNILNKSDYRVFNLEVPLTDFEKPISKCGPNLIASRKSINGYKALNIDLLTIANNHILDQDVDGLYSTMEILTENNIAYVGAGKNLPEAAKPYVIDKDGIRVGFYACAEHEFSIASNSTPGANPIDLLETPDHICELKKHCDYVIVLYHGGKEHYRYPSPNLQKVCRKLVDKGADFVVCQHSHCIGAMENWGAGTIVYGQGNFLFDHSESEFWQTGMVIELNLEKSDDKVSAAIRYHALQKRNESIRLASASDGMKILDEFFERSDEINDGSKVIEHYCDFANLYLNSYLSTCSGRKSFFLRALNRFSGYRLSGIIIKRTFDKKEKLKIQNFIECEAHRELFLQGLWGGKR